MYIIINFFPFIINQILLMDLDVSKGLQSTELRSSSTCINASSCTRGPKNASTLPFCLLPVNDPDCRHPAGQWIYYPASVLQEVKGHVWSEEGCKEKWKSTLHPGMLCFGHDQDHIRVYGSCLVRIRPKTINLVRERERVGSIIPQN